MQLFLFSIIQRRRQHVMSELLLTERDYLRDLDLLIETFLNPSSISCVRQKSQLISLLEIFFHHLARKCE